MLNELGVKDLGVIADLRLSFGPGMTVLTGETGAGKTLLVEALSLVLGERATPSLVRSGSDSALVEARFFLDPTQRIQRPSGGEEDGFFEEDDDGEYIIVREVPASGRSRAYIGGRMAPISALNELGTHLVDTHGQGEQESLLHVEAQRRALDQFAKIDTASLLGARQELRAIEKQIGAMGGDDAERARQIDILQFQIDEIENAHIADPNEEESLEKDEERLSTMASLRANAAKGVVLLEGDDQSAHAQNSVSDLLGTLLGFLAGNSSFGEWEQRVRALSAEVHDLSAEMAHAAETWEDDPAALAAVQERRRMLRELRRKYGEDLEAVLAFQKDAIERANALMSAGERLFELSSKRQKIEEQIAKESERIRAARCENAPLLADAVTERLRTLAMPGAQLSVVVGEDPAGDQVTFMLAANPGEPPAPLAKAASGGELARTMLALRLVVGGGAPTMLFDEVDAGVGGAAALALAGALAEAATHSQVLVVTHLAQVAAFADHQVVLRKEVDSQNRTVTTAHVLNDEERVVEISRMLSGHPDSPTARAHAEELLAAGKSRKASTTSL